MNSSADQVIGFSIAPTSTMTSNAMVLMALPEGYM